MKFRFLGTGTSVGVPQIGCTCKVCTSSDPRDKRRRCGAYISTSEGGFLIDAPPEMRLACIEYGISKVNGICLTHAHMDHVAGFDDLRRFNTINGKKIHCDSSDPLYRGVPYRIEGASMKCYALPETIEQMHRIFPYITQKAGENGLFRPQIEFTDNTEPFSLAGVSVESVRVEHGFPCCGYILDGKLAYVSDCHDLSDEAIEKFKGVDVMVLNCLREREHPTHLSLSRSLYFLDRIAPKRAYLVHMCHDLKHTEWLEKLPKGIEPAYDGLELSL